MMTGFLWDLGAALQAESLKLRRTLALRLAFLGLQATRSRLTLVGVFFCAYRRLGSRL